jgi:glycosyltransferase involved in cell wall biosynthesis
MNICHVSPHLPPDQAANALLPAQLGRWMRERGDEVSFVAHEAAQGAAPPASADGPVRWIPRRSRSRLVRTSRADAWLLARHVARALDDAGARADLLHLHSNGLIIEVASRWARRRGVPYVLTLYGTEIWHYRRRRPIDWFARAYRHAGAVTFYSGRLLEEARVRGLDRANLSVIYPPVPEDFGPRDADTRAAWRAALGIREPWLVVNVKRLHELAGQRFLIEAFADLSRDRRDLRLVICGTGALRASLESLAQASGVGDRVTFTGLVPNDQVARFVAAADVFVLPSLLEALPTVAVEALASGTPVISADHPGGVELHELFGDDVRLVPREGIAPLAAALRQFLEHPRRTTVQTSERLNARFRPPAVLAAFDAVYRGAIRTPPGR